MKHRYKWQHLSETARKWTERSNVKHVKERETLTYGRRASCSLSWGSTCCWRVRGQVWPGLHVALGIHTLPRYTASSSLAEWTVVSVSDLASTYIPRNPHPSRHAADSSKVLVTECTCLPGLLGILTIPGYTASSSLAAWTMHNISYIVYHHASLK